MKSISLAPAWTAVLLIAAAGATAQEATDNNITLSFEAFRSRVITPAAARAMAGPTSASRHFQLTNIRGSITIAGATIEGRAQRRGVAYFLGLDADADGTVAATEYRRLSVYRGRAKSASFKVKASGKERTIILADMAVGYRGKTTTVIGNVLPGGCMKGSYGGVSLRLIDDDLSGDFSQDGKDAILIGRSPAALPLMTNHLIAAKHFQLKVSGDGDRLELTPLAPGETAQVRLPMSGSVAKAVVLIGKQGAYDVSSAGKAGIPAGEYRLSYGIVGNARGALMMLPGRNALTYPLEAEKINIPRMGSPFKLDFRPSYSGGTLRISNVGLMIIGAGGEVYAPVDFNSGGNASLPRMRVMSGGQVVHQAAMRYG